MKTLKDFGFGKSSMEDRILEEFRDVEECFGHSADTGEAKAFILHLLLLLLLLLLVPVVVLF